MAYPAGMAFRRFIPAVLIVLALAAPAAADEPRTPALRKPDPRSSMQAFGEADKACAEWTNACVICKRDAAGAGHCSTPGIACQPKEIVCTRK